MDIENLKSWASQPDVCRCCLSTSGTWDLLAVYSTDEGEKEIYSELLHRCFGISLSLLSEWAPGRLVCDQCVGRLQSAHTFKKQVLQAEEYFVTYVNNKHENILIEKIAQVSSCIGIQNEEPISFSGERNSVPTAIKDNDWLCSDTESQVKKSKHAKSHTRTRKYNHIEEDYVSSEVVDDYEPNLEDNTVDVTSTVQLTRLPNVKQVSERKRIKITCDTVLRDTTACPFRHHKSWFQCFFCTQTFMEISSLRLHTLQTHSNIDEQIKNLKRYPRSLQIDITELQCRICNLNLIDIETMQLHFIDIHKQVIYKECIADYKVNSSPYTCHLCGKQFHVFRTLTTHLNEHYANYICDVCGKSFLNSKRLKVHNRTHEKGTFPCSKCGKVLKTKTSQANHMESHSKRVIRCQICSKPMKHYNDRIKHMSEEHNITHKFKCPICSREYNIKHYLATHIRQTHGHKNKKCAECNMAFITNHGLKKHMQKHSGVKAFSCNVCSKAYARSYTLREHMRVHDR